MAAMGHGIGLSCQACGREDGVSTGPGMVCRSELRICEACEILTSVSAPYGELLKPERCPECRSRRLRPIEEDAIEGRAKCRRCGGPMRRNGIDLLWD